MTKFPESIKELSPAFVKIYNQSEIAEFSGLSEICGMGYRKALEFLIKDFAIHSEPSDSEAIKSMSLSSCIKKYCTISKIQVLAERSAWIGNDETHYVRKHEDRDFSDMKNFIQAIVCFIGMNLATEDAKSILPKK